MNEELLKDIKQMLSYNTSQYISSIKRHQIIEIIEIVERLFNARKMWEFTNDNVELFEYLMFGEVEKWKTMD